MAKKQKVKGDYKQVVLVREDIKMSAGKIAAQVSHACVESVLRSDEENVEAWREQGMKKVILKVKDEKELLEFEKQAKKEKLVVALVRDAGHTEVKPGTITCMGIGPDISTKIDKVTGKLKLL